MDIGDHEGGNFSNGVELMNRTYTILNQTSSRNKYQKFVQVGGVHNEISWSQRVPAVLRFLFQANEK
jgi:hypothetical protein